MNNYNEIKKAVERIEDNNTKLESLISEMQGWQETLQKENQFLADIDRQIMEMKKQYNIA